VMVPPLEFAKPRVAMIEPARAAPDFLPEMNRHAVSHEGFQRPSFRTQHAMPEATTGFAGLFKERCGGRSAAQGEVEAIGDWT
jgi:hypothetical protein